MSDKDELRIKIKKVLGEEKKKKKETSIMPFLLIGAGLAMFGIPFIP